MKNPHKQYPGKMDKKSKRTYKTTYKMGYGKLKHVKMFENFDQEVNENFTDEDMQKIQEVIKQNAFLQLREPLKKLGFSVDFTTEPLAMYMVKKGAKTIAILNKKYVDNPDFVYGEIAMGLMESVRVDEVKAEAVADKNLRVTKKFADKVDQMVALAEKFEKIKEEYTVMGKLLGKFEGEVQKELEKYGAQFIRIGKVAIELKRIKGKETKSYKSIAEALEAMLPVTEEMQAAIKNVEELHTKINPDKIEMEYAVQEGLGDAISRIAKAVGDWFKSTWESIKGHVAKLTGSVDDLADKLKPLGIDVPTTTEVTEKMK